MEITSNPDVLLEPQLIVCAVSMSSCPFEYAVSLQVKSTFLEFGEAWLGSVMGSCLNGSSNKR